MASCKPKLISYVRVSTARQGASGLGIEAQVRAIADYSAGRRGEVIAEFMEIESGKNADRPELSKALHRARLTGAVLVIARLDRLSRNAAFLLKLRDSGVKFVAADMPDANEMTVGIMAVVAEQERRAISIRTKEALAAAKRRGVRLGNPNGAAALRRARKGNAASRESARSNADRFAEDLRTTIQSLRDSGVVGPSYIAQALNAQGIRARRGGVWHPSSVKNLLDRLGAI